MARYIDADKIEYTHGLARSLDDGHTWNELCATKDEIDDIPTADVVEVVRCKDCKHGMYDVMCKFYWCHGVAHSANWFCADAERREDG